MGPLACLQQHMHQQRLQQQHQQQQAQQHQMRMQEVRIYVLYVIYVFHDVREDSFPSLYMQKVVQRRNVETDDEHTPSSVSIACFARVRGFDIAYIIQNAASQQAWIFVCTKDSREYIDKQSLHDNDRLNME